MADPTLGGSADSFPADPADESKKADTSGAGAAPPGKGGGSAGDAGPSSIYDDPDSWGRFFLDQLEFPGIVVSVDGCDRPYEWAVQKASGKGGASLQFKGEKTAEEIKIICELPDTHSVLAAFAFRDAIKPARGAKPPTLPLVTPFAGFNGIGSVVLKNCGQPKWDAGRGCLTIEFTFAEDLPPSPAVTGAADPAKPGAAGAAARFGTANGGTPGDGAAADAKVAAKS